MASYSRIPVCSRIRPSLSILMIPDGVDVESTTIISLLLALFGMLAGKRGGHAWRSPSLPLESRMGRVCFGGGNSSHPKSLRRARQPRYFRAKLPFRDIVL